MQFLRAARIKDFRSLPSVHLEDIGDIAPLVGANGSGKSNVFRALNLFFNGVIEEGEPLELRRDFREPGRRQKLQISVEVDIAFGGDVRKEFQDALGRVASGSSDITVRKEYSLDISQLSEKAGGWIAKDTDLVQRCARSDDELDALVSALVARVVQRGQSHRVTDQTRAELEGWIHLPTSGSLGRTTT